MRRIEITTQFKRDYRREIKSGKREFLENEFVKVLNYLINDIPLPEKYHDHALVGEWKDFRDCHIAPDIILIYRKPDNEILQLVRIGSHSKLGL